MKENQSNFNPTFLPKASLVLCFVSVSGQAYVECGVLHMEKERA